MTPLCMHNWEKWQSYRQDRGTPPWIKVHRVLFTNPDWATLTDSEKGQLVSLWIAAADNNGCIPDNARVLRKICLLDNEPNINKFIELGFINPRDRQVDANVTPTCQPNDAPETETEAETYNKLTAPKKSDAEILPPKTKKYVSKRFIPPSLSDVVEYCKERQNSVNPQKWHAHYTSNGWMVGKNKMKCWKSAVVTWESNRFDTTFKTKQSINDEIQDIGATINDLTGFNPYPDSKIRNRSRNADKDVRALPE